jgi:hypothetical protein
MIGAKISTNAGSIAFAVNEIVNQSDQEGLFGFDNFSVQINKINDKLPTLIPIQNEFLN